MINVDRMEEQFGNPSTTTNELPIGTRVWIGMDGYLQTYPQAEFPTPSGTVQSKWVTEDRVAYTVFFKESNTTLVATTGEKAMSSPYDNFQTRIDTQVRRFVCKKNGSNKFWEVHINWGKQTYHTEWGRVGANAQTSAVKKAKKTYSYTKRESLRANVKDLVGSKLNKGYTEVEKKVPQKKKISKKQQNLNEVKRRSLCLLD